MASPEYSKQRTEWIRGGSDSQRFLELECLQQIAACFSTGQATEDAEAALRGLRADAFSFGTFQEQHRLALDLLDNGTVPEFGAMSFAARRSDGLEKRLGGMEGLAEAWLIAPVSYMTLGGTTLDRMVKQLNADAELRAKAMALAKASEAVLRGGDASLYIDALDDAAPDPDDDGKSFSELIASTMFEVLGAVNAPKDTTIRTGFGDLDRNMGALGPGTMLVIGGRPGDGKSSVALAMLGHWAKAGVPAAMVSCEDAESIVGPRVTASATGHPQARFQPTGQHYREAMAAADTEQRAPHWHNVRVMFRVGARVGDVLRTMTRAVRSKGAKVLVVDYLQAIRGDEKLDRHHEVRRIAASIKSHGAKLGVPVVLCSQLKRRDRPRPSMSDLRDAGEIEEMAEAILLLWRDPRGRWAELAKAKNGPPGTVYRLRWDEAAAAVRGMDEQEPGAADDGRRNGFDDD